MAKLTHMLTKNDEWITIDAVNRLRSLRELEESMKTSSNEFVDVTDPKDDMTAALDPKSETELSDVVSKGDEFEVSSDHQVTTFDVNAFPLNAPEHEDFISDFEDDPDQLIREPFDD